jgi:hypothetical protein
VRRGSLHTFHESAIETQTLIHTKRYTDYHRDKSFKAAWRRPPVGRETRQPIYSSKHNSCRDMKHTIYKASKPKLTPPSQASRKLLTPPLPALRKQSIGLQHSKVQKLQRRLVTPSVVLTQKQKIQISRSQKLHGHAAISAVILLNCLLRLWRLQRGVNSSQAKSPPSLVSRGHSFAAVHLSWCDIVQED